MTSQVEHYNSISRDFMAKARTYLAQDDLLQASEKGWGAAAHRVKSVAEARGLSHGGHRELWRAVNALVDETGDEDIRSLFGLASSLHTNFYEGWLPRDTVDAYLSRVEELLRKVDSLPEPPENTSP